MSWYNERIKTDFVSQYTGAHSKSAFNVLFGRSEDMESLLEKDCAEFTLDEILDLARSYRSSDAASVQSKISLLRSYTNFYIRSGFSKTQINHYNEVPVTIYRTLIDKRKAAKTYLSEDEIFSIVESFENARDKYIVLGPYEGIYGENLCELLNLTVNDIHDKNTISLCTGRSIKVSHTLYHIILDAAEAQFATYNGKSKPLFPPELVYKNVQMNMTGLPTDKTVKRKYFRMREFLRRETFGIRMVYNSGFLNAIDKAIVEYGDFERAYQRIVEIQEQYQNKSSLKKIQKAYEEMKYMTRDER